MKPSRETSLDAFKSIQGELGERQLLVLNTLKSIGIANNLMIAKKAGLSINSVTPRVLELRQKGLVKESVKGLCPWTRRMTIYWEVI